MTAKSQHYASASWGYFPYFLESLEHDDDDDDCVIAHFFGGPKDGEQWAIEQADSLLVFPRLNSLTFADDPPAERVYGRLLYRLRGTPLAGHAYYDHDPNG